MYVVQLMCTTANCWIPYP